MRQGILELKTGWPKRWIRADRARLQRGDEDGATSLRIPGALEPRRANDRRASQTAWHLSGELLSEPNGGGGDSKRNSSHNAEEWQEKKREKERREEKRRRDNQPTDEVPHSELSVIIVSFLSFISFRWKNDETLSVSFLCSEESVSPFFSSSSPPRHPQFVPSLRSRGFWRLERKICPGSGREGANTSR